MHVVHLAVAAGGEPFEQARFVRAEFDAADADLLEAALAAPALDVERQLRVVDRCGNGSGGGHRRRISMRQYNRRIMPDVSLYTVDQVRAFDRAAIEQHGIAGYELMRRAASAAFARLRRCWPQAR